jgi:alcohol dehydrogenase
MSRPIGAVFLVPHGYSNAMLLPAVIEFSKDYCIKRLADLGPIFDPELARNCDEEAAEKAVQGVKNLCLDLKIPNLQGWGINGAYFESSISKMDLMRLPAEVPPIIPEFQRKGKLRNYIRFALTMIYLFLRVLINVYKIVLEKECFE